MLLEQKRHVCLLAAAWVFGIVLYCRRETIWPAILILLGAFLLVGIADTGMPVKRGNAGGLWVWLRHAVCGMPGRQKDATVRKRRERAVMACIMTGLILTAFLLCAGRDRSDARIQEMLTASPGRELTGTVLSKEFKSERYVYTLRTPYNKVIAYYETDEISIGSEVTVYGSWKAFSPATNEGSFDSADYYREQNISFRIYADRIDVLRAPRVSFREGLYRLQQRISRVFSDSLGAGEAGVLSALTVGNKGLMDPEVKAMYQEAGISHILAISGLHISVLGFGVYRFLRRVRVPCHLCEALGCGIVFLFVIMSGGSVSSIRALVMYLLLMGAHASGRTYDPVNALALAALVLLVPNPLNLYRSGFQFSFLAMAAITLFREMSRRAAEAREEREQAQRRESGSADGSPSAHPAGDYSERSAPEATARRSTDPAGNFEERPDPGPLARLVENLKERLLFGAFLQLALLPLTAWYYFEVPLYFTLLNLLILPLCSALLGFGLAGGLLGIVLPQAAKWLLVPCHVILKIYEAAIHVIDHLPLSNWITGQPSVWLLLAFYAALVGACVLYMRWARTAQPMRCVVSARFLPPLRFVVLGYLLPPARSAVLHWLLPLALMACILFVPERQVCRIDVLDVGQGDGIFLTDGSGTYVMIDGGSSSESSVGEYEIEPFLKVHGIRKVDAWILTHGDSDHYSGLLEILEDGYSVDYLVLAAAMPHDDTWAKLVEAADANDTEVVYVAAGDAIAIDGGTMTCLYPAAEDGTSEVDSAAAGGVAGSEANSTAAVTAAAGGEDANEFSQVWRFEKDGLSALFTGDISAEQEQLLLKRGMLSDITVLKVAHHGSKYSSDAEFLAAVSPEYAVISCSANNNYGHPAPETLERLEEAGCEIYRTPQSGQITFYEKRGVWKLCTYTAVNNRN